MKPNGTVPGWVFLLIGLAGGLSLGWLVHAGSESPANGAPVTHAESAAMATAATELTSIRELLARLVDSGGRAKPFVEGGAPQALQAGADPDLAGALRDLAAALHDLPASVRTGVGSPALATATSSAAPTLKQLSQSSGGTQSHVVRETFGLAPDAVLKQYGVPDSVEWGDDNTRWIYWIDPKLGTEVGNRIMFRFHDGYLATTEHF